MIIQFVSHSQVPKYSFDVTTNHAVRENLLFFFLLCLTQTKTFHIFSFIGKNWLTWCWNIFRDALVHPIICVGPSPQFKHNKLLFNLNLFFLI